MDLRYIFVALGHEKTTTIFIGEGPGRDLAAGASVTLNMSFREYAKIANQPADMSHWTGFREIPSSSEVFDEGHTEHATTLEIIGNNVLGGD